METRISVQIETTFKCSLERAFKTPLLCDVTKIHTGYGIMPRVTHCTDDAQWGKPGSSKKVFVAKSLTQNGGFATVDRIIEREENDHWTFEIGDFQSWILGFTRFRAEWHTREVAPQKISVRYVYHLYVGNILLYPLNWIFAKTFWVSYMKHAIANVKKLIEQQEPYMYE